MCAPVSSIASSSPPPTPPSATESGRTDPEEVEVGPREMTEAFSSAPVAAGWTGVDRPFSRSGGIGLVTNVDGGSVSLLLASSVVTGGTAGREQTTH